MATDLWTVDRTGDQLATDTLVPIESARASMVEVKLLFGARRSIFSLKTGWVLVTDANPADALLAAALSSWTESSSPGPVAGTASDTKH